MSLLSRCHKHIPNPSWAVQYFSGNSRQPFSVLSASFNATSPFGCREHICLTRFQPAPWWGLSPQSPLSSVASLLHVPVLWLNDIGLSSDLGSLSHGTNTILRPMRQADVLGYSSGFQTWCLSELREALSKHRLRALTTEYSHLESVGPKNSHFFFFTISQLVPCSGPCPHSPPPTPLAGCCCSVASRLQGRHRPRAGFWNVKCKRRIWGHSPDLAE